MKGPQPPSVFGRMPGFRLFKPIKAKEFNYMPRYYDPEKEAREEHLAELRKEVEEEELAKEERRINFREKSRYADYHAHSQGKRAANLRLLVILVVLAAIAIYFFESVFESIS